jgi:hypothetical protein
MSWDQQGRRIVVAGGDNSIHVIDALTSEEIWTGKEANSSPRGYRTIFCGKELIVSGRFARFPSSFPELRIGDHQDKYVYTIYLPINQSTK